MMAMWRGDARAVVPTENMRKSRDVVLATGNGPNVSPEPFGLGIYAWPQNNPSAQKDLQPLLYVSDQVARDRSPAAHIWNGAGVREGWYWVAEPGVAFEVQVSYVQKEHNTCSRETGYRVELFVDSKSTNIPIVFKQTERRGRYVFRGFAEDRAPSAFDSRQVYNKMRQFVLEKAAFDEIKSDALECRNAAAVHLKVQAGIAVESDYHFEHVTHYFSTGKVPEKALAKEGKTLSVKSNGALQSSFAQLAPIKVANHVDIPEADVVIFIRESSWMRSRRLIDDDGNPCTYEKYCSLLHADNKGNGPHHGANAAQPALKKRKIKDEYVLDANVPRTYPGEIIDITSISSPLNDETIPNSCLGILATPKTWAHCDESDPNTSLDILTLSRAWEMQKLP